MKKILLGLTTITPGEWRNKVKEIDELGIKEIALFLTCLNKEERNELYGLLEKTGLERVPHAHLRDDMTLEEVEYFINRWGTEIFNEHSENSHYPSKTDYGRYFSKIYVENTDAFTPVENDFKKYAGICLDLAHWQSEVLLSGENCPADLRFKEFARKYKIGLNHIGAIKPEKVASYDSRLKMNFYGYDSHELENLSEVDYVKNFKNYLGDFISIELENPLSRQLEVKAYLEKMIS